MKKRIACLAVSCLAIAVLLASCTPAATPRPTTPIAPVTKPTPTVTQAPTTVSFPYGMTYMGIFNYEYRERKWDVEQDKLVYGEWENGGFRLTVNFGNIRQLSDLWAVVIVGVNSSEPSFSTGPGILNLNPAPVAPIRLGDSGGWVNLPLNPPTTPSNPSPAFARIAIIFPNGAVLETNPKAGAMSVTSEGRILSNSLDPAFQDKTWEVLGFPKGAQGIFESPLSGIQREFKYKSWSLTRSALGE